MDKETKGAWIIHHGRKIALHIGAASDYPALDESSKAAELLMRLGQTDQSVLTKPQAVAVARAANLNHRTELPHYLNILEKRKLIDISGENIAILGVTTRSVLAHANDILEDGEPNEYEQASLGLAELTSSELQEKKKSLEYISDTYHISNPDVKDFVNQSIELGFVDFEGDGEDGLLFNGNLFKRKTIVKTGKVLSSLSSEEEERVVEFSQTLQRLGCVHSRTADRILGETLFEKLKAAGFFEVNIVSNEHGEHAFVNSPGAFHKFVNPFIDDSFDMAKSLVAALKYGMTLRNPAQGRIISVDWILGALIKGRTIGPATAIGNDYRVLENNRVVQLSHAGGGMFSMRLLKREIGELALEVLTTGDANAEAINAPPGSPMTGYIGPEESRTLLRRRQKPQSKRATRDILSSLRGGRSI